MTTKKQCYSPSITNSNVPKAPTEISYLGNTITAICEITELIPEKSLVILNTTCVNQDGVEVITGKATVMVK